MLYDNKYEYIKTLGQGGFGKVFLAKENVSNRYVAIKKLLNTNKSDQQDIIHEIETIAKFELPNIVTYYHHFFQENQLFLVMEYCKGGSLRQKIRAKEIDSDVAFSYMQTLASCLRIIHRNGIIHHDIKPDNILFTEGGTIKISDFGIANTEGGTESYMSPDVSETDTNTKNDPRVDIYALGVTLIEMLTGINPFLGLSLEKVKELHQQANFPIQELKVWQQEIILRAINIVPELRFQYMIQFEEAIKSKHVPVIIKEEILRAAELVDHIEKAFITKKWRNALKYLELAKKSYPNNVSVLKAFGKYHLKLQKVDIAKRYFEKALSLNPRLDLQKDLGWINLEFKNFPIAISLLSDHLHRHPSDYEAYNLLLRAYYETERYETAMDLAKMLMKSDQKHPCFANNYYISYVMHHLGKVVFPDTILKNPNHPFIDYNFSVVLDDQVTHSLDKHPTMKSKLLFMDFHFNTITKNTITFLESKNSTEKLQSFDKCIIKIGRKGYDDNDVEVPGGNTVSRRHAIIVNSKDDVWIYDLESTGISLNNEKVNGKSPIIGLNTIEIGKVEYRFTTDNTKLF